MQLVVFTVPKTSVPVGRCPQEADPAAINPMIAAVVPISVFTVISRFGTDAGDYCRSKAYHWESPVVDTHRRQMDCRKKRGFKSSSNLPIEQKM